MLTKKIKSKKIVMMVMTDLTIDFRVLKEARSAQKAGMKVTILAKKSPKTQFKEKVNGNINVIRVQTLIGKISELLKKRNTKRTKAALPDKPIIKSGWLSHYITIIDTVLINRQFFKKAINQKPDLIHANDSLTLPAAVKLKRFGYKVIYDAHELFSEYLTRPPFGWKNFFIYWEKKIAKLDGFFSVCPSIIDEIDKRYDTRKLPRAVLYNAPPYQRKKFKKPSDKIKILFIGTKYPLKDFEIFFKVINRLQNTTLTNIGTGWDKSNSPLITNKELIPFDKLIDEVNNYDIGIIHYIPNNINLALSAPNKLFSYMMGGLAIASSDIIEVKRIIKENNNGVLFDPQNIDDIVNKINLLVKNKKKLNQYKKNSLKASKEYCWENQEKKQLKMYENLIK